MEEFQVIDHCLVVRLPEEIDHHRAGYLCERADHYKVYAIHTDRQVKRILYLAGLDKYVEIVKEEE